MAEETKLLFLMTVDGYEIYIEDAQRELYEHAADNDELTDFEVWIRVLLAEENDMFDEDEDMLINAAFHGTKSGLESELYKLVRNERFTKEKRFSFDIDEHIPTVSQLELSFFDS